MACPDCGNVFWANYATMHMNGKKCPRCGEKLEAPGRIDKYWENAIAVSMPYGGLRAGES